MLVHGTRESCVRRVVALLDREPMKVIALLDREPMKFSLVGSWSVETNN